MSEKTYEKCEHNWQTVDDWTEIVGVEGSAWTGQYPLEKRIILQKCSKCGKLNRVG